MDRTRGVAIGGAALGFALLAWVSASGSVSALSTPTADLPRGQPTPAPTPTASPTTTATTAPARAAHDLGSFWEGFAVVFTAVVVIAALVVLWSLWQMWRDRDRVRRSVPAVPAFEPVPDVQEALTAAASAQLAGLAHGSPRNAIVACWVALEETASTAGLPRSPAETSAEFTARVIEAHAVDPRAIATLSALFREARFSAHDLGEDARVRAAAALTTLHEDLSRRQDVVSSGPGGMP